MDTFNEWKKLSVEEKNKKINDEWLTGKVSQKLKEDILENFIKETSLECKPYDGVDLGFTGFYSPVIKVQKKVATTNMPDVFDIFEVEII